MLSEKSSSLPLCVCVGGLVQVRVNMTPAEPPWVGEAPSHTVLHTSFHTGHAVTQTHAAAGHEKRLC